uniref:Ig-like domain-containing protein n=1 Tax=Cyprinus carpio TaxID=7962 RepID=A0A8C1PB59_CYPCA
MNNFSITESFEGGTKLFQHFLSIPLDVLTYSGLKQSPHLFVTKDLNVTIKCSQIGTSDNIMYWFRKTPTEPMEQIVYFFVKSETWEKNFQQRASAVRNGASLDLTLVKVQSSDSGVYYCAKQDAHQSHFGTGTKLTVLERDVKEPEVEILKPSGIETRCKKTITLVCVAEKFYPDHVSITWTLGDKEIKENVATDPYATQDKTTKLFSMTSRLKVSKKEFKPKNKYRCTVNFYNGTHDISDNTDEINGIEGISLDIN